MSYSIELGTRNIEIDFNTATKRSLDKYQDNTVIRLKTRVIGLNKLLRYTV